MNATVSGYVLIAIGVLSMLGSALNWSVITRPNRLFNRLLGQTVARVIYFVVGVALFITGLQRLIGTHWFHL